LPYEKFRTGLTYADVYMMIYDRKWKRRRGVLGFWHELKKKMYTEYLHNFYGDCDYAPSEEPIPY
jgi:hypothetical protein